MTLDLDDLRAALREASADHPTPPDLLARVGHRVRRDTRRRRTLALATALTAAAVVAVAFPLLRGQPQPSAPVGSDRSSPSARPDVTVPQDPGPDLDLRPPLKEPAIGPASPVLFDADRPLPLDRYSPSVPAENRITWAVNRKARDCLTRYGLENPKAFAPIPQALPGLYVTSGFGVIDPQRAAEYGYGRKRVPGDHLLEPVASQSYPEMSETAGGVLFGQIRTYQGKPVVEGGCLAEARRDLGWTWAFYGGKVQALPQKALTYALRDSRVKAVQERWRDCMRIAGFHYASPQAALADPEWRDSTDPKEIATATADVECKKQTNYAGVAFAAQKAYQTVLIQRNSKALAPLRVKFTLMIAKVEDYIKTVT